MKKIKFLLIDDSQSTNFFNEIIIEKTSVSKEIKIAENGVKALEILRSSYIPEIILLDINMPIMDGWEFLEEFQKLDPKYKDIMIILMLGENLSEKRKEFIKTIPSIKGCLEKMLTKEKVINMAVAYQENVTINKYETVLS